MISLPQAQFQKAARFAASVVEKRNTIPALGTIKVSANGALSMVGTDLDTFASATLPYEGDEGEFLIAEPHKIVSSAKKAAGETVTFAQADKCLRMETGELVADLHSAIPADDYPAIDLIVDETFGATVGRDFFRMLDRVRPAISKEETRYYLNGIYIHKIGDWLYRFAATDGHRLFIGDVALPDANGELSEGAIIPRRSIERVIASFREAKEGARFTFGRTTKSNRKDKTLAPSNTPSRCSFAATIDDIEMSLVTKLIDGNFPDYNRVIPASHKFTIKAERRALLKAVKSLTPLSGERTRAVRILTERGGINIELHSPDIGKSRFPVPAKHRAPKDFMVGLNAQYLTDALNAFTGEEVEFGLTDPASPLTMTDPADTAFKVILMPMRV